MNKAAQQAVRLRIERTRKTIPSLEQKLLAAKRRAEACRKKRKPYPGKWYSTPRDLEYRIETERDIIDVLEGLLANGFVPEDDREFCAQQLDSIIGSLMMTKAGYESTVALNKAISGRVVYTKAQIDKLVKKDRAAAQSLQEVVDELRCKEMRA